MSAERLSPVIPLANSRADFWVVRRADGSARLVFRLGRSRDILDFALNAEGVRALIAALPPPLIEVKLPEPAEVPLVEIGQGDYTRRVMP